MKGFYRLRAWMALGIVAMIIDGCRVERITTPPTTEGRAPLARDNANAPGQSNSRTGQLMRCLRRNGGQATAVIGKSGGILVIGNNVLVVPPGALRKSVLLSASIVADTIAAIDFQPEGLRFATPAFLMLDATGCPKPAASPEVGYIDSRFEVLEELPAQYDAKQKQLTTSISHFSGYAILW